MTSNDSSPTEEIGVDFDISNNTIVNLTYYITSLILGLPGNAIILQTYARKKRKTSTDFLIMGQAVTDFVACSFSLPFIFRSGFPELITIGLCRFVFYAEEIFALNSLLLTTLISIDRYLAVCRPLRRRMTVRKSISLIILCVVISIVIYLPCPIATSLTIWNGRRVCNFVPFNPLGAVLFISLISSVFTVSFATNNILYILIYASLRKRAKIHANLTRNELPTATIASNAASLLELNSRFNYAETRSAIRPRPDDTSMKDPSEAIQVSSQLETAGCSNNTSIPPSLRGVVADSTLTKSITEPSRDYGKHIPLPKRDVIPGHQEASSSTTAATVPQRRNPSPRRSKAQKNNKDFGRKTTRMLLIVTIFLFITWIPQVGFPFIPSSIIHGKIHILTLLSTFYNLRLTNHIVNFYVYYCVNSSFRRDVKGSFAKYTHCK
eukprot:XP_011669632.1 PREDICTED: isotocin receptor-like [Strongylocentrotus purpuratus]